MLPDERFTFDNYELTRSNRFAWAAASCLAEKPDRCYSPLLLSGTAGVGKTHLLYAAANQLGAVAPLQVWSGSELARALRDECDEFLAIEELSRASD